MADLFQLGEARKWKSVSLRFTYFTQVFCLLGQLHLFVTFSVKCIRDLSEKHTKKQKLQNVCENTYNLKIC